MSAEPVEKTELEILEDKLKELETLSVRKDSDATRACINLITVVMCTFASPKLAVVMNALLKFDEKYVPIIIPHIISHNNILAPIGQFINK